MRDMPYGGVVDPRHAKLLRDGVDPSKTESKIDMEEPTQASP